MSRSRYVACYDGKQWGVWNRVKKEWHRYPVQGDQDARALAHFDNEFLAGQQAPRTVPVQRAPERPASTDKAPTLEDLEKMMANARETQLKSMFQEVEARQLQTSEGMRALVKKVHKAKQEALSRLPVQPYARRICSSFAYSVLEQWASN